MMKFGISQNGKKFRSIAVIAIAFSILSNSATAQDLYFKDVNSQSGKLDLSASSNWFTDASKTEQFAGNLSSSNNGIVVCDGTSGTAYIGSDLTLGNLEWKISGIDTSADLSSIADSATMNISGNLNMSLLVSTGSAELFTYMRMGKDSAINVGGNVVIDYTKNGNWLSFNMASESGASFTVGGDFTINSLNSGYLNFSTGMTDFSVKGVMRIDGARWSLAGERESGTYTRTIGGISGIDSRLNITKSGLTVNLVLANESKQDALVMYGQSYGGNSKLNIIMDAASDNGAQIIRFNKITPTYSQNHTDIGDSNINDITVSNGRLDVGMYSEMKGGKLSISGEKAVFSAISNEAGGSDVGNVLFAEGEWSSGKIVIDIENESSYDKIAFDGTLSKTGENISIEFLFDTNSMSELIQSSETDSFILSDAITYAEGSSIKGTVLNGIYDGIKWEAVFGDTSMNVSFTNIPEPSLISAIFALATIPMLFAKRRRLF